MSQSPMPADFPPVRHIVTRSGSFLIPGAFFEDGREYDLARHFARSIPDDAKATRRVVVPGGIRQHWRITRVVDGPRP